MIADAARQLIQSQLQVHKSIIWESLQTNQVKTSQAINKQGKCKNTACIPHYEVVAWKSLYTICWEMQSMEAMFEGRVVLNEQRLFQEPN